MFTLLCSMVHCGPTQKRMVFQCAALCSIMFALYSSMSHCVSVCYIASQVHYTCHASCLMLSGGLQNALPDRQREGGIVMAGPDTFGLPPRRTPGSILRRQVTAAALYAFSLPRGVCLLNYEPQNSFYPILCDYPCLPRVLLCLLVTLYNTLRRLCCRVWLQHNGRYTAIAQYTYVTW